MDDISVRGALIPNGVVLAAMTLLAFAMTRAAGIDGYGLVPDYLWPSLSAVAIGLLVWAAFTLAALARNGEERPARALIGNLARRVEMLLLPALIQPLFFAAFTAAKTAIAPLAHFSWDGALTLADATMFGMDPWRITHGLIGPAGSLFLEFLYTMVWGVALGFIPVLVALFATRRFTGRFFLALNLSWLIGGIGIASAMPAAGPVFAHLFEPGLAHHFDALSRLLAQQLAPDGPILHTQAYLAAMIGKPIAEEGGGISAMPSMHMATAMLYVLAARGTRWRAPAIVFAVLTAIGSVHFGYHYVMDAVVAVGLTWGCWKAAGFWFTGRHRLSALAWEAPVERQTPG